MLSKIMRIQVDPDPDYGVFVTASVAVTKHEMGGVVGAVEAVASS